MRNDKLLATVVGAAIVVLAPMVGYGVYYVLGWLWSFVFVGVLAESLATFVGGFVGFVLFIVALNTIYEGKI